MKQQLREAMVAARLRLSPAERTERSRAAAARLVALPTFEHARTVALYAPLGSEVDTSDVAAAARAAGKRTVYPRLVEGRHALAWAACAPEQLAEGPLRSREPPPGCAAVPASEIDLVVVPGLAFDARGRRLGRGRGHYDATLAALPTSAARVGLAYEIQIVDAVPDEEHDQPLHAVVTEARVLAPPASPADASR